MLYFYTQKLLHTHALLHTGALAHRKLLHTKPLHTDNFYLPLLTKCDFFARNEGWTSKTVISKLVILQCHMEPFCTKWRSNVKTCSKLANLRKVRCDPLAWNDGLKMQYGSWHSKGRVPARAAPVTQKSRTWSHLRTRPGAWRERHWSSHRRRDPHVLLNIGFCTIPSSAGSLLYFLHFSTFLTYLFFCILLLSSPLYPFHSSTLFTYVLFTSNHFSAVFTSPSSSPSPPFSRLYFLTCLKIRILRKPWFHRGWNHSFGTTIEWGCWRWMELIVPSGNRALAGNCRCKIPYLMIFDGIFTGVLALPG